MDIGGPVGEWAMTRPGQPPGPVAAADPGRGDRAARTFARETHDIRRARRFANDVMRSWDLPVEELLLVVSELATNAVSHADSPFTLSLQRVPDGVVVEVEDESSSRPVPMDSPRLTDTQGRGLAIIDHLARSWGVRPAPRNGKVVWAEVGSVGGAPVGSGNVGPGPSTG